MCFLGLATSIEAFNIKRSFTDEVKKSNSKPELKYVYLKNNNVFELADVDNKDWTARGSVIRDDFNSTGLEYIP